MKTNKQSGFTLIELIITVAIVSILAGIALPSYFNYVKRAHRADAKTALLTNAQFLERKFTIDNAYRAAGDDIGDVALPVTQSPEFGTASYTITLDDAGTTATTFLLKATPTGKMTNDECGTLTLNHLGQRSAINNTTTLERCWNK
jgi:type IV pilus assembly protein PilE